MLTAGDIATLYGEDQARYLVACGPAQGAKLLARAAEGDQWAWGRLIDEYDRLVRSVAASRREARSEGTNTTLQ